MGGIFQKLGNFQEKNIIDVPDLKIKKMSSKDIAIIGMSGKIAGANSVNEYLIKLTESNNMVGDISDIRKRDILAFLDLLGIENKKLSYQRNGYMREIDKFDYKYFNISPNEAKTMDPSQRLMLENTLETIEDAGYENKISDKKIGVYIGYSSDSIGDYKSLIYANRKTMPLEAFTGNIRSILAGRIAYYLNLKGPALVFDTACSSSLVAVHYACQDLRLGKCHMAIAGGVSFKLLPFEAESDNDVGIYSKKRQTRTFDNKADGTVNGEGVASVLLKPLQQAIEDKDNIYAIIKGSAVNQDGYSNGITAPNSDAQKCVILSAWDDAGINPEDISYIETHGTGTKLGDPIEIEGITQAFQKITDKKQFCAVGSVKTNVGHLDSAAGLASIIKCVLSLKEKKIFSGLNFEYPNKKIDFINSPVYVSDKLENWESRNNKRICGVSSFGLSGTNCHVVLQEYISDKNSYIVNEKYHIVTVSAKSEEIVMKLLTLYFEYLVKDTDKIQMEDFCYSLNIGRWHYQHRVAIIFQNKIDLIELLQMLVCNEFGYNYQNVYWSKQREDEKTKKISLNDRNKYIKNDFNNSLENLCTLGKWYSKGYDIEWGMIYENKKLYKISLPVYPFERLRCWEENEILVNSIKHYQFLWREKEVQFKSSPSKNILAIKGENIYCNYIIDELKKLGNNVIVVELDDIFRKKNNNIHEVDNSEECFVQLIKDIGYKGIDMVVHLATFDNTDSSTKQDVLHKNIERGILSLFFFMKAILKIDFQKQLELILLSQNANEVTGKEVSIVSENMAFGAFGKSIGIEHSNIHVRFIDIDFETDVKRIAQEITNHCLSYQIVYRMNKRYIEYIDEYSLDYTKKNSYFRNGGVYLIAGGLGGLGLAIAEHISKQVKATIILLGRREIPNKDKWEYISMNDTKDGRIISRLVNMKKSGSEIVYYSTDISDINSMNLIISSVIKKYNQINGVIQAAGIAGSGLFINKTLESFKEVLNPKITGTWVLNEVTRNIKLDFMLLFSSITSITGGIGQSDYTTANAYLDSFRSNHNVITINWPTWKEVGMAFDYGVNEKGALVKPLTTSIALKALDDILWYANKKRILFGELNYNEFKDFPKETIEMFSLEIQKLIKKDVKMEKEILQSIDLKFDTNCGYTDLQKKILNIWHKVLGINNIGLKDVFNEIGGNSLLAIKLYHELNREFPEIFEVTDIFTYVTVEDMSIEIEKRNRNVKNDEIDAILNKLILGELNPEEVDKILSDVRK